MADAQDLKSCFPLGKCGFDPRPGYLSHNDLREDVEADSKAIEAAIQAAVRDTLIEHKLLGQPIVVADEDGNVI
jgi:hypothetical protein